MTWNGWNREFFDRINNNRDERNSLFLGQLVCSWRQYVDIRTVQKTYIPMDEVLFNNSDGPFSESLIHKMSWQRTHANSSKWDSNSREVHHYSRVLVLRIMHVHLYHISHVIRLSGLAWSIGRMAVDHRGWIVIYGNWSVGLSGLFSSGDLLFDVLSGQIWLDVLESSDLTRTLCASEHVVARQY